MPQKTNLILFMPETLRADAVFGEPGTVAHAPNLRQLAAEGVAFENCFAQHTVCTPSRISMFTGQYPHTNGHRTLTHLIRSHERSLFRDLKEAGYVVHGYGKNDLIAAEAVPLHFTSVGRTAKPEPQNIKPWPWYPKGHPHYNSFYYGRRESPAGGGECHDHDWACVQSALDFLEQDREEPFCIFLPLAAAHPTYIVEDPWYSMNDRAKLPAPIPPIFEGRRAYARHIYEAYGLQGLTEEDHREIKGTYYGMVSRLDHQLGKLIQKLKDRGLYDNTAILFFSDHGDYTGDFGLVEKWWTAFEECLVRIPLILRVPGRASAPLRRCLVEMVDLYPTICDIAGIEPRHRHFGKSLLPLLDPAAPDCHRDAVFAEGGHNLDETYCFENYPPREDTRVYGIYEAKITLPQRRDPIVMAKTLMVRTPRYKYIYCPDEFDELYDLQTDPRETRNIINAPGSAPIRNEMKEMLLRWMLRTNDAVPMNRDNRGWF